jgi:hypothetical protein
MKSAIPDNVASKRKGKKNCGCGNIKGLSNGVGKWKRRPVEEGTHGLATADELKPASQKGISPIVPF